MYSVIEYEDSKWYVKKWRPILYVSKNRKCKKHKNIYIRKYRCKS